MEPFDPFAILGLPRRYGLIAAEVERRYLERAAMVHPDMAGENDLGGGSSDLNRAKQVLEDPEQRAIALWKLLGGVDEKSLSQAFLMEMLEVREEIENAKGAAEIARWEAWAQERRAEYQRKVGELFERVEVDAAKRAASLREIKVVLNAWRYVERLVEQLG